MENNEMNFQAQCTACGAIFTSETKDIPQGLVCTCRGKQFAVCEC